MMTVGWRPECRWLGCRVADGRCVRMYLGVACRLLLLEVVVRCWSEVLSYLYLPSSFQTFLVLIFSILVIQLAKERVFDRLGRIEALDPWNDLTSRCHLGYINTDPRMTVKAYPHTSVRVPIGCSWVLWVDQAR